MYAHKNIDIDPFVNADTMIIEGQCSAVVCCVGSNSSSGHMPINLDTKSNTPLQTSLFALSGKFTIIGVIAALAILAAS